MSDPPVARFADPVRDVGGMTCFPIHLPINGKYATFNEEHANAVRNRRCWVCSHVHPRISCRDDRRMIKHSPSEPRIRCARIVLSKGGLDGHSWDFSMGIFAWEEGPSADGALVTRQTHCAQLLRITFPTRSTKHQSVEFVVRMHLRRLDAGQQNVATASNLLLAYLKPYSV